jgi:hypothetical protein
MIRTKGSPIPSPFETKFALSHSLRDEVLRGADPRRPEHPPPEPPRPERAHVRARVEPRARVGERDGELPGRPALPWGDRACRGGQELLVLRRLAVRHERGGGGGAAAAAAPERGHGHRGGRTAAGGGEVAPERDCGDHGPDGGCRGRRGAGCRRRLRLREAHGERRHCCRRCWLVSLVWFGLVRYFASIPPSSLGPFLLLLDPVGPFLFLSGLFSILLPSEDSGRRESPTPSPRMGLLSSLEAGVLWAGLAKLLSFDEHAGLQLCRTRCTANSPMHLGSCAYRHNNVRTRALLRIRNSIPDGPFALHGVRDRKYLLQARSKIRARTVRAGRRDVDTCMRACVLVQRHYGGGRRRPSVASRASQGESEARGSWACLPAGRPVRRRRDGAHVGRAVSCSPPFCPCA